MSGSLDHVIKGIAVDCDIGEEPAKGEHIGKTPWVVFNPDWPEGDGPYLVQCPGCGKCEHEQEA